MRLYVITGMHRSGTSAVAELTRRLGAWLGDDADLLPPADDNPRGFFEHQEFKLLNDLVLRTLGGDWDHPPAMADGWADSPRLDDARRRAREFLDGLPPEGDQPIVLKDPRASLTLPFWRTVTTVDGIILAMRSPAAVAASLLRRNGTVPSTAVRLWWAYTSAALTADPDATLVPYRQLVDGPADVARTLVALLGLPEASVEGASEVIDPELDHGVQPVDDPVVHAAERVHAALLSDTSEVDVFDVALLAGGIPTADHRTELADQLVGLREAIARRDDENERLRTRLIEVRDVENVALHDRNQDLRHQLRARQADLEFSRARLRRRELDLADAQARARGQEAAVSRLQQVEADLATTAHAAEAERHKRARLEQAASRLREEHEELRRRHRRTSDKLASTQQALERLQARRIVRASLSVAQLARPVLRTKRSVDDPEPATPRSNAMPDPLPSVEDGPRAPDESGDEPSAATAAGALAFDPTNADMARPVTIVVPVHDSPDETARCLDSIARNTTGPAELLIIDDASRADGTRRLLAGWSGKEGVTVLRNEENLGFTRTINRGLTSCDTDVVILNSDTEVTPRWLEGLRIAVGSAPEVGTATAVSDDAGAFAVPNVGERNELPGHLGTDGAGRALAAGATWRLPDTPTGNGFCMYIRRAVIDDVGLLDAEAFPVGYGEENDFCMRAGRQGWRHVVADATLVRHAKGTTFGERREALMAAGRSVVDERYPDYTERVRAFVHGEDMDAVRKAAARSLSCDAPRTSQGPRVLYVLHEGRGGTPATSMDLGAEVSDRYDTFMLTCDSRRLRLRRVTREETEELWEHELARPVTFDEPHREDVRRLLAELLVTHAIELVHVRHVVKSTLDIFPAAAALDIPYVVSFHDYYMACPTVHLLDDQDRFCAGTCTPGDGACRVPMDWIAADAPHLKHQGVHRWRDLLRPHLEHAAALVTTSPRTREIYLDAYPSLDPDRFHVIEHGRDLEPEPVSWAPPEPGEAIRLLVPGNLDVHKGSEFLRAMKTADRGGRVEIHLMGERDDDQDDIGVTHGPYEREEFAKRVASIRPHLIGIFATWAETYNHTLTEAWMTGVPAAVTDLGALGERVRAHGGGLLVPHDDPGAALLEILAIADDPQRFRDTARLGPNAVRSVQAMGEDYDELYRDVLAARRAIGDRRPLRLALVALGRRHMAPGSVQVRSVRPLSHPALALDVSFRHLHTEDLLEEGSGRNSDFDLLVIQRTAVEPDQADRLLEWSTDHRTPLIVEIDDLLFDPEQLPDGDDDWAQHVQTLRALMSAAELVTVSTEAIEARASEITDRVVLVPNHVDERLWFRTPSVVEDASNPTLRLLYAGSRTHAADLELLRPALDLVRERLQRDVVLDVVGGTPEQHDWFRRVPVPAGRANYPAFASWLAEVAPGHLLALAPLTPNPFNDAKSDLKWLEYSALGLPGVYSDRPSYAASVTDGVTGRLVGDAPWEWADAIVDLVSDPDRLSAMAVAAQTEVRRNRTLDRHVRDRLALYRSVGSSTRREMA